jgi:hypothetical protein
MSVTPSSFIGKSIGDPVFSINVSPVPSLGGGDLLFAKTSNVSIASTNDKVTLVFYHKFMVLRPIGEVLKVNSYMAGGQTLFATQTTNLPSIVGVTFTTNSYDKAMLVFDTSSAVSAADTPLIKASDAKSVSVSLTAKGTFASNGTLSFTYGLNAIYVQDAAQTLNIRLTDVTFSESAINNYQSKLSGLSNLFKYDLPIGIIKPGAIWNLNFSMEKNLYWAQGNLRYSGGAYSFYAPYAYDGSSSIDLFKWNALKPGDTYNTSWIESNDPCRKYNAAWRVPTANEMQSLVNAPYVYMSASSPSPYNKPGSWIGSDENTMKSAIAAGVAKEYLFLAKAGTYDYWTSTAPSKNMANLLEIGGYTIYLIDGDVTKATGYPIRCVSDTQK